MSHIKLAFKKSFIGSQSSSKAPLNLVFLHSFLSCGRSAWNIALPNIETVLNRHSISANVYFLDQRYHGETCLNQTVTNDWSEIEKKYNNGENVLDTYHPSSTGQTLMDMSSDLYSFLLRNSLTDPILIGHSMGARVAMIHALICGDNDTFSPSGIVSIDASPATYTHTHSKLVKDMYDFSISTLPQLKTKEEVWDAMVSFAPSVKAREFIIEQLHCDPSANPPLRWSVDLLPLMSYEYHIRTWPTEEIETAAHNPPPYDFWNMHSHTNANTTENKNTDSENNSETDIKTSVCYTKPTLFIGARSSSRLTTPEYIKNIPTWFPNQTTQIFTGGHFVHEGPDAVKVGEVIGEFIKDIAEKKENKTNKHISI